MKKLKRLFIREKCYVETLDISPKWPDPVYRPVLVKYFLNERLFRKRIELKDYYWGALSGLVRERLLGVPYYYEKAEALRCVKEYQAEAAEREGTPRKYPLK